MDSMIIREFTEDKLRKIIREELTSIKNNNEQEEKPEKFYTTEELAEKFMVRKETIRAWTKNGKIRGKKIGRRNLYTEEEVEKALNYIKPSIELQLKQIMKR